MTFSEAVQRSGAPADFGLRKLDECPTYPCGFIREHAANIARALNWSEEQGEIRVQDLIEKFIDSLVRPTSGGFKIVDFTIYCIDVNIRDGKGSKSIDIITTLDRDKCKVTSESKRTVRRKSIIMGRNNS